MRDKGQAGKGADDACFHDACAAFGLARAHGPNSTCDNHKKNMWVLK
jgi:hypothetical protein